MVRVVESSLRTMNNLLERLHASFFFFLFVNAGIFMKIGMYLPSAILVGTAMLFTGLGEWVNAGWIREAAPLSEKAEKTSAHSDVKWTTRHRPVLPAVSIMLGTHLLGVVLFYLLSNRFVSTLTSRCKISLTERIQLPNFFLFLLLRKK